MSKLEWKPVQIEGVYNEGDLDGLIGIEELTDYNYDAIVTKKNSSKKRKAVDLEDNSEKTTKKTGVITKLDKNVPGAFVRPPNFFKNTDTQEKNAKNHKSLDINSSDLENEQEVKAEKKKKKKRKRTQKVNVEIGAQVANKDDVEKYTDDDFKAWDFAKLPDELMKGLMHLGFLKPTLIQEKTLQPAILGRRDILGVAETGSGKTLAFGLPILTGILNLKKQAETLEQNDDEDEKNVIAPLLEDVQDCQDGVLDHQEVTIDTDHVKTKSKRKIKPLYALILTPTRELAIQVKNHLQAVARFAKINVAAIIGGIAAVKQERVLAQGPEIVVATPGRLWELMETGDTHLSQLDNIRYLVIDETDRMLERGHYEELQRLLERLNVNEERKKLRQNFVFSATLILEHDLPQHIKKKLKGNASKIRTGEQKLKEMRELLGMTNPKLVNANEGGSGTAHTLTECRITCTAVDDKDLYTYYFICRHPGRTLIFCNSVSSARRLATLLSVLNVSASALHSSMQQRQRLRNIERFRDEPHAILVATDVAARGLDIPHVDHVLHYHVPRTAEIYVHRSGRTARATNAGITVLLVAPEEVPTYTKLCRTIRYQQDLPSFPIQRRLVDAARERVKLARILDAKERTVKKRSADSGWLKKAAEDMEIIIDDEESGNDDDSSGSSHDMALLKRETNTLRKKLNSLLSKPLFPADIDHKILDQMDGNKSISFDNTTIAPELREIKAIDLMKSAIENGDKVIKSKKLYKPKLTVVEKKKQRKLEKQQDKRKRRKTKKEKLMKDDDEI